MFEFTYLTKIIYFWKLANSHTRTNKLKINYLQENPTNSFYLTKCHYYLMLIIEYAK